MSEIAEQVYFNDWDAGGEEAMLRDFGIDKSAIEGCKVLIASYTYENYEGSAYVLFEKDGKLFEVHGGHCSCYGLSQQSYYGDGGTQWEPEEVDVAALRHRLEKGTWGEEARLKDRVLAALNVRRSQALDELGALDGELLG